MKILRLLFRKVQTLLTMATPPLSSLEAAKKAAACKAVDVHVQNNQIIGIGSGSTIVYGVKRLAERVKAEKLNVKCVPSSYQAKQLIIEHKLPLTDLDENPNLDVCIDGADEVDFQLSAIKGGGGCLLQEKIVASCAKEFIIVADYTKKSTDLGTKRIPIPIEVVPLAHVAVKPKVENVLGGNAELRMAKNKAGPVVTDNGNFILDLKNYSVPKNIDWEQVNAKFNVIPGVVETGLFVRMAKKTFLGLSDGSAQELTPGVL